MLFCFLHFLRDTALHIGLPEEASHSLRHPWAGSESVPRSLQVAKRYHKPKPLLIKVKISKPPKVTMKAGKSLMHLHGSLEMFVARRHGKHPKSLFRLETVSGPIGSHPPLGLQAGWCWGFSESQGTNGGT